MNTRKGQVGVALAALLVVACGDAAVGMVMEDGGGAVDDLGGMLVDIGMGLVDAGQQVSDAGTTVRDMGEGMDSAVAQGPGPWMNATCTTHTYVQTATAYVLTYNTFTTTFDAPNDGRWEVETCGTVAGADADNDGCNDTQPANTTCVSDGPRPTTTCYYSAPTRLPNGTVRVACGAEYTLDYVNPGMPDTVTSNQNTVRYRRL